VPGNFSTSTSFSGALAGGRGSTIVSELNGIMNHITLSEVGARTRTTTGWIVNLVKKNENTKISLNLFDRYVTFIESISDSQPGNVAISKASIIYGDIGENSDAVVPISDELAIYNNINSADKAIVKTNTLHWKQTEDKKVKTEIKKRLNE
jgi:hypothetical protein